MVAEQRERLAQTPKQQKLIATNALSVAQRLSSIVIEIVNNRLEEAIDVDKRPLETRLTKKIVDPLMELQNDAFPKAVQLVERARRAGNDMAAAKATTQELISHQEQLVNSMKQILSEMSQAEGYQEAINLIYEVEKMQREVFERTKKAKEEKEKGIIQGRSASQ